jgi:DNA-binding transcriptional LysR family regulator
MDERDWRIIDALYHEQSISRTAQALYISQPALTARLHQIERDLGTVIVVRTSKGVRFTPQGEYVAKTARSMLREFSQVRGTIGAMSSGINGTLHIAASQFMMKYILPEILRRFKDQYPGVEFNLVAAWSKDVYGIVRCRDVHVGFVLDVLEWEDERYRLFDDPLALVSTSEIKLDELPDLPRIEFRTNPSNKAVIDRWWEAHFDRPPRVSMIVDILDTCHEMVRHGLGYAILPKIIVKDDPLLHIEELRDSEGKPLLRTGWMVYSSKAFELPIVERFVDFVKSIDGIDNL